MNHIRETKVFVLCREGSTFDMDELELELWYLHLEDNLKGKSRSTKIVQGNFPHEKWLQCSKQHICVMTIKNVMNTGVEKKKINKH